MHNLLIKALKPSKKAVFSNIPLNPHPEKSNQMAQGCRNNPKHVPSDPKKSFLVTLITFQTSLHDIWDDLKKVHNPPPLKKIPIF